MTWFAVDVGYPEDAKIAAAGEKHGPAAVSVMLAVLRQAKLIGTSHGELEVTYRTIAHNAFLDSIEQAREILDTLLESKFIEMVEQLEHGLRLSLPAWAKYQRAARDAHRKALERAESDPSVPIGPDVSEPVRSSPCTGQDRTVQGQDSKEAPLSHVLAGLIEMNGSKRPEVSKAWTDAERLLLTKDERPREEAEMLLHWCQADNFWRGNILSMPKFREKYDQLRLQHPTARRQSSTPSKPGPKRSPEAEARIAAWSKPVAAA